MKTNTLLKTCLMLGASAALLLTGCRTHSHTAPTEAAPSYEPVQPIGDNYSTSVVDSDLFTMTKRVPANQSVGETFTYEYVVEAKEEITNVVITDVVPNGLEYVSSSPNANATGKNLSWNLGQVSPGSPAVVTLTAKATSVGTFANCATITATPLACVVVVVGQPELIIDKSVADSSLLLGETADFTIVVTNVGNTVAKDVVITDALPKGLTAQTALSFPVGDLAPQESKTVSVLAGTTRSGEFLNTASAQGSNVGKVSDDAVVLVKTPGLSVTKEGTVEQYVGKKAKYDIVVTNTGDITLTDVIVTDTVGQGMTIASASGAMVQGNTAVWEIASLPAGQTRSFTVHTNAQTEGYYCNEVTVADPDMSLTASDSACTTWKGFPAVLLEVIDTNDPLLEGASSSYVIKVTNQGNASDYDIEVSAMIPSELMITSISGSTQGTAKGGNVTFEPYPVLAPKEVIEFIINVDAKNIGGARSRFLLDTKLLGEPISEIESTQVY